MVETINPISDFVRMTDLTKERFLSMSGAQAQPLQELGVALGGISHMVSPYIANRTQAHDEHVVLFSLGGQARFLYEGGEGNLQIGDLLICPAHQPHQYFPDPIWECCWFHFWDTKAWSFLNGYPVHKVRAQFAQRLVWLMDGYIIESTLSALESTAAALSYSQLICAYLRREFQFFDNPHGQGALYQLWVSVLADLSHPWRVEEMAKKIHCSVPTLYRLVAKHHGERPMEVLTRLRMQRTTELLGLGMYSLAEIADMVGYSTPYSLSRVYKRFTGHAPGSGRQQKTLIRRE